MNHARRLFVLSGVTGLAALMSGCTTPAIKAGHSYKERVSTVLISQDKQKIVFMGDPSHYVFDAPAELVGALALPFHGKASGDLSHFHVDKQGKVSGMYSMTFASDLPDAEKQAALASGFQADGAGQLTLEGKIGGMRFLSGKADQGMDSRNLNKTYTLDVSYDPSNGDKVAEAMITPIIVTSEGLFFIYNIVLAPVLLPLGAARIKESCVPYCMGPSKPTLEAARPAP